MGDFDASDMEDVYPARPEDNIQYVEEMPIYRHIGGQMFDPLPSFFNDQLVLPEEDELMVDIPTYHKGVYNCHFESLSSGGVCDSEFEELLRKSDAISLQIPSSSTPSSSGSRPNSPFASLLPVYDCDDLLPLESTHLRVSCCCDGSVSPCPELREATLMAAINAYLQDNSEKIQVHTDRDLLETATVGHWKCSTGVVNTDFSWVHQYTSFAIQCYVDATDGNMIVEWQRRRGCVHTFHVMFEKFRTDISVYMSAACQEKQEQQQSRTQSIDDGSVLATNTNDNTAEVTDVAEDDVIMVAVAPDSMTVVPSIHPGRVSVAVKAVQRLFIDPTAKADVESEFTPKTISKCVSMNGSVTVTLAAAVANASVSSAPCAAGFGMPKLQRDSSSGKGKSNISPTGPVDLITMFSD